MALQASIAKDETPQEDQQMPQSPFLMGGQDAAESESGSAVEDPAALEAKVRVCVSFMYPFVYRFDCICVCACVRACVCAYSWQHKTLCMALQCVSPSQVQLCL
eukprot:scaffold137397_cov19-Tisochrysis_lutea.AAC.1